MARLENSISAWAESWGTSAFAEHVGQCGQPRPDAVRRTRPPVVTTSHRITSVATAVRWNVRSETGRDRRRGSDGVSAWAIPYECIPARARAGRPPGAAGALHLFTGISRKYRLSVGFGRLRLEASAAWHSLGVVGTRSPAVGHDAAVQPQRAPKGEFVSGELAADCARFLAETRRRVEQRRTVETPPLVRAGPWRASE